MLLDLHMADQRGCPPQVVESRVFHNARHILAMSAKTDEKTKALAESFGAVVLLDKKKLVSELIPAMIRFCSNKYIPVSLWDIQESAKVPQAF